MKVAIYCRVSKRDMHPENQFLKLKERAERESWTYDVFEEKESTRKTRPIKEQLLKKLRNKEYDVLLIYKLDRWARSLPELALEFKELYDKGINIVSIMDSLDFSSATGRLQFHMLCAFAEFERDLIRERTLDGLERARAEGRIGGRPRKKTSPVIEQVSTKEIKQNYDSNKTSVYSNEN